MLDTYSVAAGAVKLGVPEREADFYQRKTRPKIIDLFTPPFFLLN